MANRYFAATSRAGDVVWTYSGVRPLLDDRRTAATSVTRDYVLELDDRGGAPLLSIFGGKITTYRRLAEDALDRLAPLLGIAAPWTARRAAAGRRHARTRISTRFERRCAPRYPWLPRGAAAPLRARLRHARRADPGRRATSLADLGEEVLPGLHGGEIDYLRREEWARTAEDILWRRTKLGAARAGRRRPRGSTPGSARTRA